MSKKWIFLLLVLSIVLFVVGLSQLDVAVPAGIQTKGESGAEAVAYVALATSVLTLLTAIAGLIKTLIEAKKAKAATEP